MHTCRVQRSNLYVFKSTLHNEHLMTSIVYNLTLASIVLIYRSKSKRHAFRTVGEVNRDRYGTFTTHLYEIHALNNNRVFQSSNTALDVR